MLNPTAILWRNDSRVRELERLERYVADAFGTIPDTVTVEEDGLRFQVSPRTGQKTGWFYDQRDNRARLDRYVAGRRVLDMFSYVGAWGVRAAAHGAREVLCVDSSTTALEQAMANATLNGVGDRVRTEQGDAFEVLKSLREARERFDVVIVDPPALSSVARTSRKARWPTGGSTRWRCRCWNAMGCWCLVPARSCSPAMYWCTPCCKGRGIWIAIC